MPLPTSLSRAKNHATPSDLVKVLKANELDLQDPRWQQMTDVGKVCSHFEEAIIDMLALTPRLDKEILKVAARRYDPRLTLSEATEFGQKIQNAVSYCRMKSKQMTTGAKLLPAVCSIIEALKKTSTSQGSPVQSLLSKVKALQASPTKSISKKRKLLRRRSSAASSCSPLLALHMQLSI